MIEFFSKKKRRVRFPGTSAILDLIDFRVPRLSQCLLSSVCDAALLYGLPCATMKSGQPIQRKLKVEHWREEKRAEKERGKLRRGCYCSAFGGDEKLSKLHADVSVSLCPGQFLLQYSTVGKLRSAGCRCLSSL